MGLNFYGNAVFHLCDFSVSGQVVVPLLFDPGQGLPGGPLEETELLGLIQTLLLLGPVVQHPVLLVEQFLQDGLHFGVWAPEGGLGLGVAAATGEILEASV